MPTQTSAVLKLAKEEGDTTKPRFKSIKCGFKSYLRNLGMQEVFIDHSSRIGKFRHLVTLVVNEGMVHDPSLVVVDWMTFYQHLWAALERKMGIGNRSGPAQIKTTRKNEKGEIIEAKTVAQRREIAFAIVDAFFDRHPLDGAVKQLMATTCPVEMRQQECVALATATHLQIQLFPQRMRRYVRARLVQMLVAHNGSTSLSSELVSPVTDLALCGQDQLASKRASLESKMTKHIDDVALRHMLSEAIGSFVQEERDELADLVGITKPYKGKQYPPWVGVMNQKRSCYQMLPHLHRLSTLQMQMVQHEGLDVRAEDEDVEEDGAECLTKEAMEQCGSCEPSESTRSVWTRRNRPLPFALLPMSKLQNSMVYYGCTEVKALYADLRKQDKGRKRKRTEGGEEMQEGGDEGTSTTALDVTDDVNFAEALFDFRRRNPKKRNANHGRRSLRGIFDNEGTSKWRLSHFRTNGVQCVLTFVTGLVGSVHGVTGLVEKGYSGIEAPDEPFDISTRGARGIYRLTQARCDIKCSSKESVKITALDPGQKRPVQMATVAAGCAPNAATIAKEASFDHIDQKAWMQDSGRQAAQHHETHRRKKHAAYAQALDRISKCRRRCVDTQQIIQYSDAMLQTLVIRCSELLTPHRAYQRWKRSRALQKHISRVADKILDRSSLRLGRYEPGYTKTLSFEARQELLCRLQQLRHEKRVSGHVHVVFFGDGTFGHMRGNAAVPKKDLLHELGVRGPTVLIDEYKTSKMCPCGHELCDGKSQHDHNHGTGRVRVHKTIGDDSCEVLAHRNDRDELAAVNMLLAALHTLHDTAWPAHLVRNKSDA